VAVDRLQGRATITTYSFGPGTTILTTTTQTSSPRGLENKTSAGVVIGGGVDIPALFLHISPEVRYTHWTLPHFALRGPSQQREPSRVSAGHYVLGELRNT